MARLVVALLLSSFMGCAHGLAALDAFAKCTEACAPCEECVACLKFDWDILTCTAEALKCADRVASCKFDCGLSCKDKAPDLSTIIGDVKDWSTEQWKAVEEVDLEDFFKAAKGKGAEVWGEVPTWFLRNFTDADWAELTDLAMLSAEQLKEVNWDDAAAWSKAQWDSVPLDTIVEFGWEQLQQVPFEEIAKMTSEQLAKVPVDKLVKLLGENVAKLDADTLASFTDEYWDMIPVAQLSKFTTQTFLEICKQVAVSGATVQKCPEWVTALDADKVASIAGDAWKSIPIDTVLSFSVEQLQAINYTALSGWTKVQWDALPVDTIITFTGDQIQGVPADVVASWSTELWQKMPIDQVIQLTGEQVNSIPFGDFKAKLDAFTAAQIEQLSAETKKLLEADPTTKAILDKIKANKDKTDAVYDMLKDHADKVKTKITLQESLSEIEATPGATVEDIQVAKSAVAGADVELKAAEVNLKAAKTDAGMEDAGNGNGGSKLSGASLALCTAAAATVLASSFA